MYVWPLISTCFISELKLCTNHRYGIFDEVLQHQYHHQDVLEKRNKIKAKRVKNRRQKRLEE
jgi:hypothetical protein